MRVIFLVYRTNYYRYYTPVIQEALRRGYTVECWHDYSAPRTGTKGFTFPDIQHVPDFPGSGQPQKTVFEGPEDLEKKLREAKTIDAVVSIYPLKFSLPNAFLDQFPFTWVTLMTGPDNFFQIPQLGFLKKRRNKELFLVHSESYAEKGQLFLKNFHPEYTDYLYPDNTRMMVSGNAEFDAFKGIDPDAVRAKYGLPAGKKILLYLPFPYCNRNRSSAWERAFCGLFTNTASAPDGMLVHDKKNHILKDFMQKSQNLLRVMQDPLSRRFLAQGMNEAKVFHSIREFCLRNNLHLVVKPRMKFPVADYVKESADQIVWDDERQQNPPVLKELLTVSRMCVMYYSFASLAAIYAGVYCLNVNVPKEFFINEAQRFWFSGEKGSQFNYPGVIETWEIEDVISRLPQLHLKRFEMDREKNQEFIRNYMGYGDGLCSRRVWDAVNAAARKRPKKEKAA
ncbi:MAG: hypothetical protein WC450_05385 [Candidatus Omnitrophota bacterium]|jgi:hypothetical protein